MHSENHVKYSLGKHFRDDKSNLKPNLAVIISDIFCVSECSKKIQKNFS